MKKKKRFFKTISAEKVVYVIVSAIFMVVALSYLYSFGWGVVAGLKTHKDIVMTPFEFPEILQWQNYLDVFTKLEINGNDFFDMLFNSIYFSVFAVFVQMITTVSFAYVCSKYEFPGHKIPYIIVLVIMTLPVYGSGAATYKLYKELGFINSYIQIIASASGFNAQFLYFTAFFKNMSWTYAEAAMIDGANDFQIYGKVMLPQTKPIFGALFLTLWLTIWNSYESALIYLPKLPTLPVGIYQFNVEMQYAGRLDILFAACIIISIPAIVLFIAFNKVITTNVSIGGIKG